MSDGSPVATIKDPVHREIVSALVTAFPEARAALDPDGLRLSEFEAGPVA